MPGYKMHIIAFVETLPHRLKEKLKRHIVIPNVTVIKNKFVGETGR